VPILVKQKKRAKAAAAARFANVERSEPRSASVKSWNASTPNPFPEPQPETSKDAHPIVAPTKKDAVFKYVDTSPDPLKNRTRIMQNGSPIARKEPLAAGSFLPGATFVDLQGQALTMAIKTAHKQLAFELQENQEPSKFNIHSVNDPHLRRLIYLSHIQIAKDLIEENSSIKERCAMLSLEQANLESIRERNTELETKQTVQTDAMERLTEEQAQHLEHINRLKKQCHKLRTLQADERESQAQIEALTLKLHRYHSMYTHKKQECADLRKQAAEKHNYMVELERDAKEANDAALEKAKQALLATYVKENTQNSIYDLKHTIKSQIEEINELKGDKLALERAMEDASGDISAKLTKYKTLVHAVAKMQGKAGELTTQLNTLRLEHSRKMMKLTDTEALLLRTNNRLADCEFELTEHNFVAQARENVIKVAKQAVEQKLYNSIREHQNCHSVISEHKEIATKYEKLNKTLQQTLAETEAVRDNQAERIARLEKDLHTTTNHLKDTTSLWKDVRTERDQLQEELDETKGKLKYESELRAAHEVSLNETMPQYKQLQEDHQDCGGKIVNLTNQLGVMTEDRDHLASQLSAAKILTEAHEACPTIISNLEVRLTKLKDQYTLFQVEKEKFDAEKNEQDEKFAALQAECDYNKNMREELEQQVKELNMQLTHLQRVHSGCGPKIDESYKTIHSLEVSLFKLEEDHKNLQDAHANCADLAHQLEVWAEQSKKDKDDFKSLQKSLSLTKENHATALRQLDQSKNKEKRLLEQLSMLKAQLTEAQLNRTAQPADQPADQSADQPAGQLAGQSAGQSSPQKLEPGPTPVSANAVATNPSPQQPVAAAAPAASPAPAAQGAGNAPATPPGAAGPASPPAATFSPQPAKAVSGPGSRPASRNASRPGTATKSRPQSGADRGLEALRNQVAKVKAELAECRTELAALKKLHSSCGTAGKELEDLKKSHQELTDARTVMLAKAEQMTKEFMSVCEDVNRLHVIEEEYLEVTKVLKRQREVRKDAYQRVKSLNPRLGLVFVGGHEEGVTVTEVTEGEPADDAGLEKGDIITQVNSKQVLSKEQFVKALSGSGPGDSIYMLVKRDGIYSLVALTIGAYGYSNDQLKGLNRMVRFSEQDYEIKLPTLDEVDQATGKGNSKTKSHPQSGRVSAGLKRQDSRRESRASSRPESGKESTE